MGFLTRSQHFTGLMTQLVAGSLIARLVLLTTSMQQEAGKLF
jgi:hypothetical protein